MLNAQSDHFAPKSDMARRRRRTHRVLYPREFDTYVRDIPGEADRTVCLREGTILYGICNGFVQDHAEREKLHARHHAHQEGASLEEVDQRFDRRDHYLFGPGL